MTSSQQKVVDIVSSAGSGKWEKLQGSTWDIVNDLKNNVVQCHCDISNREICIRRRVKNIKGLIRRLKQEPDQDFLIQLHIAVNEWRLEIENTNEILRQFIIQ